MFMRAMENILIVGAGLTGAVTAALIKKHLPGSCQLTVRSTVWEKTDAIGNNPYHANEFGMATIGCLRLISKCYDYE